MTTKDQRQLLLNLEHQIQWQDEQLVETLAALRENPDAMFTVDPCELIEFNELTERAPPGMVTPLVGVRC